ncbi:bifunctional hydroxymethylpyrimidine kinase/phosphomethylpyrimidine kinase [Asticcacaulis sp. AND118]|uniref:bifunctional hydroxymethylpyrimidine kinase/phosphomethylpyrimidine kinase n=1 Tax=Asticcacaulis sp. AND118 TaxID=2840468 RepID=UPI001CFFC8AD|nr:bifunctional hydroxymethylpyrimidine kinase/phosphomethylpyrimidine kinase [Asticcacaulis sp. AND118]UDF02939.1 bifunctional hydroxymethylpyrimidine kinase/phosphomethylpyrimidine kinase [Asticcacaulis sp. AND118]
MRRVLIIAGSDPSGGAGIQADLKAVTCLGGYAMTAITALTVQNTLGVTDVMPVPEALITAQGKACLSDIGADAVKTGMLGTIPVVETVAALLDKAGVFTVVDPVMVAKGGHPLLPDEAIDAIRRLLIPRAGLLTPNAPEAAVLTGIEVVDEASQRRAGEALLGLGAKAVLMKGGHIDGAEVVDWLLSEEGERRYVSARIETRHTHGTGCTLASACATLATAERPLGDSVDLARDYVLGAIITAPNLGGGHGPLRHNWVL